MTERPFRFGLHLWSLPLNGWVDHVRRYEALGFSSVTFTDHVVVPQWEPFAALGAIAAVTERLKLGTLVLDMGLRNPVLTAKSAATLQQISGGRLELGVGAGYVRENFAAAGVPFMAPRERVSQLEEAVLLMRRLWTEPSTTAHGRFYDVTGSPMVSESPAPPRLVIGGGGKRMVTLGGRLADAVSLLPRQSTGEWSMADSLADSTLERMTEKASWVRRGAEDAGRKPEEVELNTMAATVIVGGDVEEAIAKEAERQGVGVAQLMDSSLYLCGTGEQLRARLERWRSAAGISYVSIFDPTEEQIDYLARHVVGPLAGGKPADAGDPGDPGDPGAM